jgi:hypothetical protein
MTQKRRSKAAAASAASLASAPIETGDSAMSADSSLHLTEIEIAARAYSYWQARGCTGGSAEEDWYRAIDELTSERDDHS